MPGRRRGSSSSSLSRISRGSINRSRSVIDNTRATSQRRRRSSRLAGRLELELSDTQDSASAFGAITQDIYPSIPAQEDLRAQLPDALDDSIKPYQAGNSTSQSTEHQYILERIQHTQSNYSAEEIKPKETMSVIVNPPARIRPGDKFGSPLIVGLRADKTPTDMMTVLSVVAEDGKTMVAPPAPDIIRGNLSGSLQFLDSGSKANPIHLFNDIELRKPGKYRLKIIMMEKKKNSFAHVAVVVTDVITVDANVQKQTPGIGTASLKDLENRGLER